MKQPLSEGLLLTHDLAFIGFPRLFGDIERMGYEAAVVRADHEHVVILTHDLYQARIKQLTHAEFFSSYQPCFGVRASQAAINIGHYARAMLKSDERTTEAIKKLSEVPLKKKEKSMKDNTGARACADHQRRTCIEISRQGKEVTYIPLSAKEGLQLVTSSITEFDRRFKPVPDYPVDKAAKLYVEYSRHLGASHEALEALGKLTEISKKDREMATTVRTDLPAKNKAAADPKVTAGKVPKAAEPAKTKPTPASKAESAKTKSAPKAAEPAKTKSAKATSKTEAPWSESGRETAAKLFQALIMEGKLTDDQIFEQVKAKFNLDEKKRSYVRWYRNHLAKQGKNPPAAKI